MRHFFIPSLLLATVICFGFASFQVSRPESYFIKGNTLTFKITAENGAISYAEVQIKSVDIAGNTTRINAQDNRLNDQRKSTFQYRMNYCADSLNWCVDALNHLNIPLVYSSNFIPTFDSDSLVYPYDMKVGDTLRPAFGWEKYAANKRAIEFNGRIVKSKESIIVNGETMSAFRIECKMIYTSMTDYGALGNIASSTEYTYTEWFVPTKGVVKSEKKSSTGVTTMTLTETR